MLPYLVETFPVSSMVKSLEWVYYVNEKKTAFLLHHDHEGVKIMAKIYGYARCSTNESKQDIDRQTRDLKANGAEIIFQEFEHGDSVSKEQLDLLLSVVQEGDTIVTLEVSRLSRSTKQLCDIIEVVKEKKIRLCIIGSITVDCRSGELDPMTAAFLQMAGVFAELELKMIRQRVKSGMANAAAKGTKLGRPTTTAEDIPEVFKKHLPLYRSGQIGKSEFARLTNLSRPTIDKYLRLI